MPRVIFKSFITINNRKAKPPQFILIQEAEVKTNIIHFKKKYSKPEDITDNNYT